MIADKTNGAAILRLYVWELLKDDLEIINGLIPIIPLSDEPRMAGAGKPYAIYGYADSESRTGLEQIRTGVLSIRFIVPNQDTNMLFSLSNEIAHAFESSDVATEAVNRWSSLNNQLNGIRFTQIGTTYVDGGEGPETEGGDVEATVNIGYRYIKNVPIPIPESAQGGLWT